MGEGLGKLVVVSWRGGASMGIFMHDQSQPLFGGGASNVDQEGDGSSVEVTNPFQVIGVGEGNGKDLNGRAFPGVKTMMTRLEQGMEDAVNPINLAP